MGNTLSTPRDHNQPPWPPRSNPGPNPGPNPGQTPGYPPQQAGNPFAQQPTQWAQPPAQYGQPPQYGQSPQYRQPPAQYGPAPTLPKKSGSKSKPFLIAGAVVAVLLVVIVGVLIAIGANQDVKKIAVADVQTEVQQVLVDRVTGYSSGDITDVKCNNGQDPTVKNGGSFTCNVTVRGKPHELTVTFKDANGTYEVGLPQLEGGK